MKNREKLLERNIGIFYVEKIFEGLGFFWAPIMVAFQMYDIGLNLAQILLGESFFAITILVLEIPTGFFADKLGRRISVILGFLFKAIGITIFAFSGSFVAIILSQIVFGIGWALNSGAESALLYDSLKELRRESEYKQTLSKLNTISYSISVFTSLSGGVIAYFYGFKSAILLSIIAHFASLIISLLLVETTVQNEELNKKQAIIFSLIKSFRYIWKHKIMRYLTLFIIIGGFGMKLSFHTLNPFWEINEVPIYLFGFAIALYNVIASGISHFGHKIVGKLGDIKSLLLVLLVMSFTFIGISFIESSIALALLIPGIFNISRALRPIIEGDIVNSITYSHHRATVMSIQSFLNQGFQALFLPIFGYFVDIYSLLTMYLILGIIILLFGGYSVWKLQFLYKNQYKHS